MRKKRKWKKGGKINGKQEKSEGKNGRGEKMIRKKLSGFLNFFNSVDNPGWYC